MLAHNPDAAAITQNLKVFEVTGHAAAGQVPAELHLDWTVVVRPKRSRQLLFQFKQCLAVGFELFTSVVPFLTGRRRKDSGVRE